MRPIYGSLDVVTILSYVLCHTSYISDNVVALWNHKKPGTKKAGKNSQAIGTT